MAIVCKTHGPGGCDVSKCGDVPTRVVLASDVEGLAETLREKGYTVEVLLKDIAAIDALVIKVNGVDENFEGATARLR